MPNFRQSLRAFAQANASQVPNHLPLYADTREGRGELSADGVLWTTYFNENGSGHGWRTELTEKRSLDEAALRAALAG